MSDLDLDELRATYDHPADKSVIEVIDRLEQAEQAVARVRGLNQFLPASIMERITLALDGDTRRLADQGLGGGQDG